MQIWENKIEEFVNLANINNVKMIFVGGAAVNFHDYQRHSADVDIWIETTEENLNKLLVVFNELGYEIDDFPAEVKNKLQNISVKFSPHDLDLELITNFNINKSFDQAYLESEVAIVNENKFLRWNVLSLEDLISSKIKSNRPKDLLDIQLLRQINMK